MSGVGGKFQAETNATRLMDSVFEDSIAVAYQRAREIMSQRGQDYDISGPIWHRMPFKYFSYATMLAVKVGRLVQAVRVIGVDGPKWQTQHAKLEEHIKDLLAYTLFMYAHLITEETEMNDVEKEEKAKWNPNAM